jgi:phenylacetate-coenzyme A ligase PaaK-like adenylate-forming protein
MDQPDITKIFETDAGSFEKQALSVFHFQYNQNPLYRHWVDLVTDVKSVKTIDAIPFLPIDLFKTQEVKTTAFSEEIIFESSGTTGMIPSRHFVRSSAIYETSFTRCFQQYYGEPSDYCILALLPSYLERKTSSLVYMVNSLMKKSGHALNGFFLNDISDLNERLKELEMVRQKTLLIGVSFALLDFAEKFPQPLNHTLVMETGGMKGRRKEIVRSELHYVLKNAFQVNSIHSEYGMTELLSQAYAKEDGKFHCPPWMKVVLRDEDDPAHIYSDPRNAVTGGINVIDLANVYSCSFIATEDSGKLYGGGCFEVLGRLDNSDIRGCSLLAV